MNEYEKMRDDLYYIQYIKDEITQEIEFTKWCQDWLLIPLRQSTMSNININISFYRALRMQKFIDSIPKKIIDPEQNVNIFN